MGKYVYDEESCIEVLLNYVETRDEAADILEQLERVMLTEDRPRDFKRLKDLIHREMDSVVVKDTYTKGKNAGLRKVLALIDDIEQESQ